MGSINITTKIKECGAKKGWKIWIWCDKISRGMREELVGFFAPLAYAPFLSSMEMMDHLAESNEVLIMWGISFAGEESDSVANVEATNNVGVDEFT